MFPLPANISESVKIALAEDIQNGDLTASLIPQGNEAEATVICRDSAVIAGIAWFNEAFNQVDANVKIKWFVQDGDKVEKNTVLCEINGNARHILSVERTALNFLQTLSSTATETAKYAEAVSHTKCKILDTRKTIPGLRDAQKYAVLCGGGKNHRKGLYDGILIKENHIMAAGSITNAVQQAKLSHSHIPVEVEVENLDELEQALDANADIILLDNMNNELLRAAVKLNNSRAKLEASGGVTLNTITAIAETGVDFISIGNLTKNINAIDLSMRFNPNIQGN
ncbi:MAG: carboxylating nicotinate-nucleotide diphosphorylase [Gammaproteobacteria bacterium]|nr:carboxylating nicotinate-nucleotide diphosphorylase [Gammaproteobacteria bacterium]